MNDFLAAAAPVALWSGLMVGAYFLCRWVSLRVRFPLLHPGFTGILTVTILIELKIGRAHV